MNKIRFAASLLALSLLVSACSSTSAPGYAEIPAGKAYVAGEEIFFAHTETSDPGVAELLSAMMKSPVLVVPSLAEIPEQSLGKVYVFKNGIAGSGPLKFQADVFPDQPGDPTYTPLRRIVFVTWADESLASLLKSEDEILAQLAADALNLEESGIVVNMPFMTWKEGKR